MLDRMDAGATVRADPGDGEAGPGVPAAAGRPAGGRPVAMLVGARVTAVEPAGTDELYRLDVDGLEAVADRAVGCLVAPEAGDRVLVCRDGADWYVLAVLDRSGGARTVVSAPAGRDLEIAARSVAIAGTDGVSVATGGAFAVSARSVDLVAGAIHTIADTLVECVRRLQSFCGRSETTAGEVVESAAARTATVRGADHLSAGTRLEEVEGAALHKSHSSLIVAEEDVRMEATRITMG